MVPGQDGILTLEERRAALLNRAGYIAPEKELFPFREGYVNSESERINGALKSEQLDAKTATRPRAQNTSASPSSSLKKNDPPPRFSSTSSSSDGSESTGLLFLNGGNTYDLASPYTLGGGFGITSDAPPRYGKRSSIKINETYAYFGDSDEPSSGFVAAVNPRNPSPDGAVSADVDAKTGGAVCVNSVIEHKNGDIKKYFEDQRNILKHLCVVINGNNYVRDYNDLRFLISRTIEQFSPLNQTAHKDLHIETIQYIANDILGDGKNVGTLVKKSRIKMLAQYFNLSPNSTSLSDIAKKIRIATNTNDGNAPVSIDCSCPASFQYAVYQFAKCPYVRNLSIDVDIKTSNQTQQAKCIVEACKGLAKSGQKNQMKCTIPPQGALTPVVIHREQAAIIADNPETYKSLKEITKLLNTQNEAASPPDVSPSQARNQSAGL